MNDYKNLTNYGSIRTCIILLYVSIIEVYIILTIPYSSEIHLVFLYCLIVKRFQVYPLIFHNDSSTTIIQIDPVYL